MNRFIGLAGALLLLLPTRAVLAQAATTPAEYELGTHGIAAARTSGQALPKGYALREATSSITGQFTITLEYLVRESTHELAAIIIQMQHPNWTTPRYLCLPNAASEVSLKQQYLTEVIALTPNNTQAVATALALRLTALSSAQRH